MDNVNVGLGIGLQARPKDRTESMLKIMSAEGEDRARKKGDTPEDMIGKWVYADRGKYHRLLAPEAEKATTEAMVKVMKYYQEDPNNWKFPAYAVMNELKTKLNQLTDMSADYQTFEKVDPMTLSEPARAAQNSLRTVGTFDQFKGTIGQLNDPWGTFQPGEDGTFAFSSLKRMPDYQRNIQGKLNTAVQAQLQSVPGMQARLPGAKISYQRVASLPETEAEALSLQDEINKAGFTDYVQPSREGIIRTEFQRDPSIRQEYIEANRKRFADAGIDPSTDPEAMKKVEDMFYNDMKTIGGQKVTPGIISTSTSKPSSGGGRGGAKITEFGPKTQNIGTSGLESLESIGGVSFSSPLSAVSAPGVYYNPVDKKLGKDTSGALRYQIQDVQAYSLSPTEGLGKYLSSYYKDKGFVKEGRVGLYVNAIDTETKMPVMLPLTDELEGKLKLNDEEKAKLKQWKNSLGIKFNKNGFGEKGTAKQTSTTKDSDPADLGY